MFISATYNIEEMDIIIRLALWQYMVTHAVLKCPLSVTDWNKSSMALQCKEPNYYHCLRDENGNIAQQCLQRVWIQDGMCPEYNSRARRIDVYECKSHQGNCPKATFWSNAVYIYHGCFGISDATSTTSQPTRSQQTTSDSKITSTYYGTRGFESTNKDIMTDKEKEGDNMTVVVIVAVCAVVIIILIVCIVILRIRRRRRQNSDSSHHTDSVPIDVQGRSTGDIEEEQTTELLEVIARDEGGIEEDRETDGMLESNRTAGAEVRQRDTEKEREDIELKRMESTNSDSENRDTKDRFFTREKDETDGLLETCRGNNPKMEAEDKLNLNEQEQDADKLEKNGVIIFISDDKSKNDLRINSLDSTGRFGQSLYVASLSLWDLEEDISLYLFLHSLNEINSAYDLMQLTEKLEEMHKQAKEPPEIYFALSFQTDEWRRYEKDLLKYNFFREASKVRL